VIIVPADDRIKGHITDTPTGEGAAIPYSVRMQVAMDIMRFDIQKFIESITNVNDKTSFYRLVTEHLSAALIDWCYDTLFDAVDACPYETGKLRSSGAVDLIVGTSERVEDNAISVQADSDGGFDLRIHTRSIKKPASRIGAIMYFDRQDKGLDIALWSHELLLPAANRPSPSDRQALGKRVWYAVQPGTGPKYLENAVKKNAPRFDGQMSDAVWKAVRAYNRKHGQKVRKK